MSRKNRNKTLARQKVYAAPPAAGAEEEVIGKRGRMILALALVLICAGYVFLKKTDSAGENIYAALSPVFLLGGYLLAPVALCVSSGRAKPENK
ncbi:MAG: hypothetical protein A2270_04995 [Elusimicrobia bacterium RIFOXYA12_FULL_51_18]|nr:MAG: hypothetical protein A2270_04995 [Elusimicrobia bacterium RIFOXYA12_FULL_51_18]OGS30976.1 MAG: hypothetical protein A2218_07720 [Elusimicrobia bacterium RIFOXYA2_FULL_53_38]